MIKLNNKNIFIKIKLKKISKFFLFLFLKKKNIFFLTKNKKNFNKENNNFQKNIIFQISNLVLFIKYIKIKSIFLYFSNFSKNLLLIFPKILSLIYKNFLLKKIYINFFNKKLPNIFFKKKNTIKKFNKKIYIKLNKRVNN